MAYGFFHLQGMERLGKSDILKCAIFQHCQTPWLEKEIWYQDHLDCNGVPRHEVFYVS